MEENKSLSFDQLPSAVSELLTKVNTMMTRLDDIGQRIGNAPSENDHVLMDIREASTFVRKKVSSLYAYTSERRIPFYKRGNMEKPLNFDPFGHARFAHLFVLYD